MIEKQFSLLMCVCPTDNAGYFELALRSVTVHQTKKPDEVVLVLDGDVGVDIIQIIETVFHEVPVKHQIIRNVKQMGLAYSLNHGLQFCSKEWVARMDADDMAMPERFCKQMSFLIKNPSIAVLGSSIREFGNSINERDKIAVTNFDQIRKILKYRNPMNHPSCIFNRSKILSVGGYPNLKKNQDYGLWLILVAKGNKLANLDEVLLKFRITENFYSKRGIQLLKHDLSILFLQRRLGFISILMMIPMFVLRIIFRSLPPYVLKKVYSASRK